MRVAKIQLKGQFVLDRRRGEPLARQIVSQLRDAIVDGRLAPGALLPSTRALARLLRVSRNTVLIAYDELKASRLIVGRQGASMRVAPAGSIRGFDVRRVVREGQYPSRTITVMDPDGNAIRLAY
jgi:DNA-binding transcriptional regulator YhcF (GntR family)